MIVNRAKCYKSSMAEESEKPAGTYARHILDRLLVDLSWASSQLEGNTYSLLDTKRLIEHGQAAEGKDAVETQMILNHKAAIEFLVDSADDLVFNRFRLRFRNELTEVVSEIVRSLSRPAVELVTAAAVDRVPAEHLDDFVRMALNELDNLHEGNYARFRLRPSEYQAWRESLQRA